MRYIRVIIPVAVQWDDSPGVLGDRLFKTIEALTDEELRTKAVEIVYNLSIHEALDLVRGPLVIERGEIAKGMAS